MEYPKLEVRRYFSDVHGDCMLSMCSAKSCKVLVSSKFRWPNLHPSFDALSALVIYGVSCCLLSTTPGHRDPYGRLLQPAPMGAHGVAGDLGWVVVEHALATDRFLAGAL